MEHVHTVVEASLMDFRRCSDQQIPRQREDHCSHPHGNQQLSCFLGPYLCLWLPDYGIVPVKGDQSHSQGGDDPKAAVKKAVGHAEPISEHPGAILAEEHDEGEGQTQDGREEIGQRQRHDEGVGHRPQLSVLDDDDDDSGVAEAGEEEDEEEHQGLGRHRDTLQNGVTLGGAQHRRGGRLVAELARPLSSESRQVSCVPHCGLCGGGH